jgi:hypothetical protein
MANRSLVVHCHFYQPPREDPLTGKIPVEEGAQPFHDWNEKIHATCYLPNAQIGNIQQCSFDVGPTLWMWMRTYHADTCKLFVEQENTQYERWGVGNGMAHPYHHVILPLATRDEKVTQVYWGMEEFRMTFGHAPKGMWLPETAVDRETMDVISEQGVKFIILSPSQARTAIDSQQCYRSAENEDLVLFFYDKEVSTRVSFDPPFTRDADEFAPYINKMGFHTGLKDPLMTIATDGELYGHHQPFRDLFLHRLFDYSLAENGMEVTYPGKWLATHQPQQKTGIIPNTSWSCPHGIERWRGPCDCTPHGEWKTFLRLALNNLAKLLDEIYLEETKKLTLEGLELRNQYIQVINNRMNVSGLCHSLFRCDLTASDLTRLEFLLAAQYERLRMFTSCAWFFEDFDRIEPKNSVRYAAQAVWLTKLACGRDLEKESMAWLKEVKSSRSGLSADVIFSEHLAHAQRTGDRIKA